MQRESAEWIVKGRRRGERETSWSDNPLKRPVLHFRVSRCTIGKGVAPLTQLAYSGSQGCEGLTALSHELRDLTCVIQRSRETVGRFEGGVRKAVVGVCKSLVWSLASGGLLFTFMRGQTLPSQRAACETANTSGHGSTRRPISTPTYLTAGACTL